MKKVFGMPVWVWLALAGLVVFAVVQKEWLTDAYRAVEARKERNELLPRVGRDLPMFGDAASNEDYLNKKVERSSAIAFSNLRRSNGGGERVITEIFHLAKGLECHYQVGDVIDQVEGGPSAKRAVHFFRGHPAKPCESMTIHAGYLLKQKDLPESGLRKLIQETVALGRPIPKSPDHEGRPFLEWLDEEGLTDFYEVLTKSAYVVVAETRVENGFVGHYATKVIELKKKVSNIPLIGDQVGGGLEAEEGTRYGAGGLCFFDGERQDSFQLVAIHHGRLESFGGMKLETALKRIEAMKIDNKDSESK